MRGSKPVVTLKLMNDGVINNDIGEEVSHRLSRIEKRGLHRLRKDKYDSRNVNRVGKLDE